MASEELCTFPECRRSRCSDTSKCAKHFGSVPCFTKGCSNYAWSGGRCEACGGRPWPISFGSDEVKIVKHIKPEPLTLLANITTSVGLSPLARFRKETPTASSVGSWNAPQPAMSIVIKIEPAD